MASFLPPFDPWRTGALALEAVMTSVADARAVEAQARRRLVALLDAASRRSRLAARWLDGRDPATVRLRDLPVTRKRELMASFEDWVGDPDVERAGLRRFLDDPSRVGEPYLGGYLAWESSGSSGEPAMFVQDAAAMAVYDALEAVRRPDWADGSRWLDPWGLGETTVFVGATGGHFASNVSLERLRRLNPALRGRLHIVSFLQPLEQLCRRLEAHAPSVVATYPTQAVVLAEERLAGRLRIAPREIWTGGETLTAAMRALVARAFGCRVVNTYGSSEFLSLATDCPRGRLHLNADWAILEPVDGHGRPVEPGTSGATTLLTNLANVVQPLVRYDLGDRVVLHAERCACGSPLPTLEVEGRSDDVLRVAGNAGRTVSLLPLALATVVEEEAGLFDFQLVQRDRSCLELRSGLRASSAAPAMRRARVALEAFLQRQGARPARVECHAGAPMTVGRSGKIPRVVACTRAPPPPP